ncbi:hypothetical protein GCM10009662_43460 [Catellatospora coxensis]|uniref:Cation/H+ exchanger transmembrane domain-containing protein n=1 Tax=Catellatospora coxensis TaxID=310354 RepID=A0A8J3KR88_9ACTN|nr:hypothetical protein Cco03nite_24200 [Catellatospora coxensis]
MVHSTDPEQLLLRVFGLTLLVAGLAELVNASAAVGAFLFGLALTGQVADRTRRVIAPLRDLFATVFFFGIGLSVDPSDIVPVLPVALAVAAAGTATKMATGWFAAARDGAGTWARLRAGSALIARGEFSLVIASLPAAVTYPRLGPFTAAFVIVAAIAGPVIARLVDVVEARARVR